MQLPEVVRGLLRRHALQDPFRNLHDGDLEPQFTKGRGRFKADVAATDDHRMRARDEALTHRLNIADSAEGKDAIKSSADFYGKFPRSGTCGNYQMIVAVVAGRCDNHLSLAVNSQSLAV